MLAAPMDLSRAEVHNDPCAGGVAPAVCCHLMAECPTTFLCRRRAACHDLLLAPGPRTAAAGAKCLPFSFSFSSDSSFPWLCELRLVTWGLFWDSFWGSKTSGALCPMPSSTPVCGPQNTPMHCVHYCRFPDPVHVFLVLWRCVDSCTAVPHSYLPG